MLPFGVPNISSSESKAEGVLQLAKNVIMIKCYILLCSLILASYAQSNDCEILNAWLPDIVPSRRCCSLSDISTDGGPSSEIVCDSDDNVIDLYVILEF